jgi:hypothetical protein
LPAKVAEDFAASEEQESRVWGFSTSSAKNITAPNRRQQLSYYKIVSVGFEGMTLIYTRRIVSLLLSTQQRQSDMNSRE